MQPNQIWAVPSYLFTSNERCPIKYKFKCLELSARALAHTNTHTITSSMRSVKRAAQESDESIRFETLLEVWSGSHATCATRLIGLTVGEAVFFFFINLFFIQ